MIQAGAVPVRQFYQKDKIDWISSPSGWEGPRATPRAKNTRPRPRTFSVKIFIPDPRNLDAQLSLCYERRPKEDYI